MYHSTPETQTDESYNHPEDIEHFAQHEQIELEEAEREAKFQGISVEEALAQHEHEHVESDPSEDNAPPANAEGAENPYFQDAEASIHPHDDQAQPQVPIQEPQQPFNPKVTRVPPPEQRDPSERYRDAKKDSENHDAWGSGDGGFKVPSSPSERMRCVIRLPKCCLSLTAGCPCSQEKCTVQGFYCSTRSSNSTTDTIFF